MTDRNRKPLPPYNPYRDFEQEATGVLVFRDVPPEEWTSARPGRFGDSLSSWQEEIAATKSRSDELHRMPYKEYLQTPEWKRLRSIIIRRAQFLCERCGKGDQEWNVHHLTYERRGYEELSDLVLLCRGCHEYEHGINPDNHEHAA